MVTLKTYTMSRWRFYFAVLGCLLFAGGPSAQAQRFATRVFDEVSVIHGILFNRAENIAGEMKELRADLYEPYHDTMARRPMVITVFGGAFVAGSRDYADMVAIADTLAHHGFVVASIDYRLVPTLSISPTNMMRGAYMATQDVSAAIRFFKAKSDHYGIDTTAIFLLGNSAGSIASLYTVFMKNDERPEEAYLGGDLGMLDDSGLDISRGHTSRVAGVVAQWGGVSDLEVIDADETTPICMIHGTADKTVPYTSGTSGIYAIVSPKLYGSYSIAQRMDSLGMKHYELHPFEGESHAFYFGSKYRLIPEKLDACLKIAIDFLCRHL